MISKVTRGGDMRGLMRYLVGPGKHNEHTEPHLVAGSAGVMAWFDDSVLDAAAANQIGSLLDNPRKETGTEVTAPVTAFNEDTGVKEKVGDKAAHVWHCSLSLAKDEGAIGDEKWSAIAGRFVELMDINDGVRSEARWSAVHHGTSTAGNDHIHLVVGLVREDGTKVNTHHDYARTQRACATIEAEFGLRVIESRTQGRAQSGLSRAELRRNPSQEPERRWLERVVSGAATSARTEDEFVRRVRSAGALIRPRFAAGGQNEVVGYSVARRAGAGEKKVWFGGGRVSPDLTLTRLRAGWEPGETRAVLAEWQAAWRGVRPVGVGPEVHAPTAQTWQRGLDEMQAIARKLSSVPLDDHATWTSVARQVGGVLSAWSSRLEPEPGPLAAAAKNVRDYARVWREPEPSQRPAVRLSAQAYLMAAVATRPDSVGAQMAMMKQLVRTLSALHDAQAARGQIRTARATEVAVTTHLATWRDELNRHGLLATSAGAQAQAAADLTRMNAAPTDRGVPLPGPIRSGEGRARTTREHVIEQGSSRE
ncbi:MAG: relaxase/mobilization nuclease domain-containing protein [Brachybacterium sp.]